MAYCDIQDRYLGKKLNSMFLESNRNAMANIVSSPEFNDWFGNGRRDVEGSPLIDETLSFTNEKGEKLTVFDFAPIAFETTGEVKKMLKASPAVRQHDGELFINNTKRDITGQYAARYTKSTIDVINYYYPDLLMVETYRRTGKSVYSKDVGIPLNVIRVTETPLVKNGKAFTFHEVNPQGRQFSQLYSVDELVSWKTVLDEFRNYGISQIDLTQISEKPKVSDATYDKLVDFMKKLNPNFKVEVLDNLGANGIAYIQDFLIQLDAGGKLEAIPEEVAHFFVELLPDSHPLKKELLANITNFAIYSTTLQAYKNTYKTADGKVDYDKIKREAAAKLIAEFIYALSEGDNSRLSPLLATKQGWLGRWWDSFVNMVKDLFGLQRREAFQAYVESANKILTGDIEYLTQEDVANSARRDIFFQINDASKMQIAQEVLASVEKAGKLEDLQKVIHSFRRELADNWKKITKDKGLDALNKELMKEDGVDTGINYLDELYNNMKALDVTEKQVGNAISSDSQMIKFSEFIDAVINMNRLSKSIHTIVQSYDTVDNYEMNITELQSFRAIYENFRIIVTSDLASVLTDSEVSYDIREQLDQAANAFNTIELEILKKLKKNYTELFKEKLAPQNLTIVQALSSELEGFLLRKVDSKHTPAIRSRINQFVADVQDGKSLKQSRARFTEGLKNDGVEADKMVGPIVDRIFASLNVLYTPDEAIRDLLEGTGSDIDRISATSHWVTAAIKNKDVFVSNVAKYIVDKRTDAQNSAQIAVRGYNAEVKQALDTLSGLGLDEYEAGEAITYIDEIFDRSKGENREIVKFLSPTTNAVVLEKDRLYEEKNELRRKWKKDENSAAGVAARKEFLDARQRYIQFLDDHFNSPFKDELRDFQSKWNQNDDFLDIKEEWDFYTQEYRNYRAQVEQDKNDRDAFEKMLNAQKLQKRLLKDINPDGTPKTAQEIAQVKLLKDFFEESGKFRVEDERRTERNYRLAENNYASKIAAAAHKHLQQNDKSPERFEQILREELNDDTINVARRYRYLAEVDDNAPIRADRIESSMEISYVLENILLTDFELRNSIKVKNQKFYDAQKFHQEQIEILKKEQGLSALDQLVSDLYKKINDVLVDRKDFYGQRNPEFMTQAERNKVILLENQIANIKMYSIRSYKILPEVRKKMSDMDLRGIEAYDSAVELLSDYLSEKIPFDEKKVDELKQSIYGFNDYVKTFLTKAQIDTSNEISEQFKDLRSMVEKKPTAPYWERMETLIDVAEAHQKKLQEDVQKLKDQGLKGRPHWEKQIKELSVMVRLLESAIYQQNHLLLDKIINDEYLVEGSILKFSQFAGDAATDPKTGLTAFESINGEFMTWFNDIAHKAERVWVQDVDAYGDPIENSGAYMDREYSRRMFYTASEPSDPYFYDLKRPARYRATKLDEQWKREQVKWNDPNTSMEDWTVTNKTGRDEFLPLSRKQLRAAGKTGEKYEKYLNKKYYEVQDGTDEKSKALKSYLDTTMKTYLREQESKPDELKGMFNYPVVQLDHFKADVAWVTNTPDRVKNTWQTVKGFFGKQEETDAQAQVEGIIQMKDIDETTGEYILGRNNRVSKPVLGMNAKLPVERINRNALSAMLQYISHSKDFDARVDLDPVVGGLIDVMKANEVVGRQNQKERTAIFDKIYKQMIVQELPDNVTNQEWFRKMANGMMTLTAMKLQGDVIGGSVNYIQANLNNIIEAAAGKYVTLSDYRVGYVKATRMMAEMGSDWKKKSDLSYWTLMYEHFDFIQGEWLEDMEERTSLKGKAFNWRKMLMYPRKNGELHAQSAMAIAILNHTEVLNTIDGKKYPMWDIYKKEGENLVLKEGFDEERYNPKNGTVFQDVKNRIHAVNIDLHGNYAKFNQTEASRHSIGKIAENMKRWFVPGFQRRFGREYFDVSTHDIEEGYYRTGGKFLKDMFVAMVQLNGGHMRDYWDWYTKTEREKYQMRRFGADMAAAFVLWAVYSFAFGYDDDDPDKNQKMKESSWMRNWALIIFLRSHAEQTAYIPVPPLGFTEMARNLLDPFSVAKGAVTNLVALAATGIFTVGYYLGIEDLSNETFYSRDTGSQFGEKGDMKLVNYFLKTIGYTGSQLDPAFYLKNYEQLQNRLK